MALNDVKEIKVPNDSYYLLEYIESAGNAAFNTDANSARNSFLKLEIEDLSNGASVQGNGRDNPGNTNARFFAGFDSGKYWFGLGSSTTQAGTATAGKHTLAVYGPECPNGSGYEIDGTFTSWTPTFPSSATWYSLFLFANRSDTSNGFNCQSICRIYSAEFGYYNGNNIGYNRRFIPVQRKSDNQIGFFDLENNTFNIDWLGTTANITAGPIVQDYIIAKVKTIADSNGNIIWGSQSAFPYRRLEYIHFNGTDNYIYSGVSNKNGYYRSIICDIERNDVRQTTLATYDGMVDNAKRRFYIFDIQPTSVTSGTRACLGNTWSTTVATSNIPLNKKLKIYSTCQQNGSNYVMYAGINRIDTGAAIISLQTINNGTNSATGLQPYLMGCRTRSTEGVDRLENPVKGKLYQFDERSGNSSGTLSIRMVPCQRKSDGAYGFLNIINGYWYVIRGTVDSTTPGPIVDEY